MARHMTGGWPSLTWSVEMATLRGSRSAWRRRKSYTARRCGCKALTASYGSQVTPTIKAEGCAATENERQQLSDGTAHFCDLPATATATARVLPLTLSHGVLNLFTRVSVWNSEGSWMARVKLYRQWDWLYLRPSVADSFAHQTVPFRRALLGISGRRFYSGLPAQAV